MAVMLLEDIYKKTPAEGESPRKKSKPFSQLLGTSLGDFSTVYSKYEAKQHFYNDDPDSDDTGFFGKEDPASKYRCNGYLDMIWRLCRFEMLYFGTNKTIWDVTVQPILIFFSRRVSGIFNAPAIDDPKLPKHWKASGYFGFGKVALLKPGTLVDKFMSEITNLSIVAALFLTFTIPILVDGNVVEMLDDNAKKFFFIFIAGLSVIGQLSTAVVSLSIVTNLNKCVGDESRVLFILSIFNPRNGITGFIGVALYLGAIFSWVMTIWMTLYLTFLNFGTEGPDFAWGVMYLVFICVGFLLYFTALIYGISAENKCSTVNFDKVNVLRSVELIKAYVSTKERLDDVVYTRLIDLDQHIAEFGDKFSSDEKKQLLKALKED